MDTKRNSRLSGLISKLTTAANQAKNKESKSRKFANSAEKNDYRAPLNITSLKANLRTT